MIVTSIASGVSVAAAKQIFKKSVFSVDNVGLSHNADDISSFVSSMAINLISCFEVKPRRRRDEKGDINDRKALRLSSAQMIQIGCWTPVSGRTQLPYLSGFSRLLQMQRVTNDVVLMAGSMK